MTAHSGDDGVPNVARMYDYFLGGSHNFASDRERAHEILAARPDFAEIARANRSFLRHAVERLLDQGIRQFLDLGSGIPTVGNVHEIAHRHDPDARVAYVDNERVAVAHSAAIVADVPNATITDADLRDAEAVLAAPGVAGLLDFARPVGLLAVTALHFVAEAEEPGALLSRYRRNLAPGSVLVVTHVSDDYPDAPAFAAAQREAIRLVSGSAYPVHLRSRAEIVAMMEAGGFTPDARGPREVRGWAVPARDEPLGGYAVISEPLPAGGR